MQRNVLGGKLLSGRQIPVFVLSCMLATAQILLVTVATFQSALTAFDNCSSI